MPGCQNAGQGYILDPYPSACRKLGLTTTCPKATSAAAKHLSSTTNFKATIFLSGLHAASGAQASKLAAGSVLAGRSCKGAGVPTTASLAH